MKTPSPTARLAALPARGRPVLDAVEAVARRGVPAVRPVTDLTFEFVAFLLAGVAATYLVAAMPANLAVVLFVWFAAVAAGALLPVAVVRFAVALLERRG